MTNDETLSISIRLSPAQVDDVVRAASNGRAPSIATLISNMLAAPLPPEGDDRAGRSPGAIFVASVPSGTADPRLSRSLLRGLSLLACFGHDGCERGIVELAGELGMSPSTAHRYALTL